MADGITFEIRSDEFINALSTIAEPNVLAPALLQAGLLVETRIKANASGRPGPRVVTGNYRRSWNTRQVGRGGQLSVVVGTNSVYGPRLEYGFTGTDSRGRRYNQPPFPHVAPAVKESEKDVTRMLEIAVIAASRGVF